MVNANGFDCNLVARAAICAFFAILFLQSGFDKVFDWKGNLDWLTGHFGKSPLKGMVRLMLGTLTFFELATGVVSAAATVMFFFGDAWRVPGLAMTMAAATLLMLFFGQRVAKDYPGAAVIATYFVVAILGLWSIGTWIR